MSAINLPVWARVVEHTSDKICAIVEVDSEVAYSAWLDLLNPGEALDQYWLEVAYQCIKMDVQAALEASPLNPILNGKPAQINFTRADRWALNKYRRGKGTLAASKGREARDHYLRLRGRIPFSS